MVDLYKNIYMKSAKWTTISGIILCLPCCLLPILGITVGGAAVGSFLGHLEKLGIALLVLSPLMFAFRYFRKRKACNTCGNHCNCKGTTQTAQN
ncbi:MAG: hypothetical protein C5B59_08180 [Bacteroidetes bacterium]|nr:MAG: hypothetical protein C5B59_08180 [Bacteroidota bacterium]